MNLTGDSIAQRSAATIFTDLDDTVVIMDTDRGTYDELDPVGTRIWMLLENPPVRGGGVRRAGRGVRRDARRLPPRRP